MLVLRLARELILNSVSVLSVCWVSILVVARIYDFHTAYIHFIQQIAGEDWLHQQCQDDAFFKNMQYHTDVCEQVVQNRQTSPVLYALNASMQQMKLCGLSDCQTLVMTLYTGGSPVLISLVCLYIFTPSFLLPLAQRCYEKHQHRSLMRRCAPTYQHQYAYLDSGPPGHVKHV